jgi:hypothetical protein
MKKIIFILLTSLCIVAFAQDKKSEQIPDSLTISAPRLELIKTLENRQKDLQSEYNNLQIMLNIYKLDTRDTVRIPKPQK